MPRCHFLNFELHLCTSHTPVQSAIMSTCSSTPIIKTTITLVNVTINVDTQAVLQHSLLLVFDTAGTPRVVPCPMRPSYRTARLSHPGPPLRTDAVCIKHRLFVGGLPLDTAPNEVVERFSRLPGLKVLRVEPICDVQTRGALISLCLEEKPIVLHGIEIHRIADSCAALRRIQGFRLRRHRTHV